MTNLDVTEEVSHIDFDIVIIKIKIMANVTSFW